MPEEQTFSDLPSTHWDAIDLLTEWCELSNRTFREYLVWGLQIGPYDDEEAEAILWS